MGEKIRRVGGRESRVEGRARRGAGGRARRRSPRTNPGISVRGQGRDARVPAAKSSSDSQRRCRISSPGAPTFSDRRRTTSTPPATFRARTGPAATSGSAFASTPWARSATASTYDGLFRASGATFLVFADYMRASIRLAALSRLPVRFHFHARLGRCRRGRPDPPAGRNRERTAPHPEPRRDPPGRCGGNRGRVRRRARTPGRPDRARPHPPGRPASWVCAGEDPTRRRLPRRIHPRPGNTARSRPSSSRAAPKFSTPSKPRGNSVPASASSACRASIASTARAKAGAPKCSPASAANAWPSKPASPILWWKYVGENGRVIGIDRFGLSAPGAVVLKELGISAQRVVDAVKSLE